MSGVIRPHKGTQVNDPLPTKFGKPVDLSVHPMARAMSRSGKQLPRVPPQSQVPKVNVDEDDSLVTGIN